MDDRPKEASSAHELRIDWPGQYSAQGSLAPSAYCAQEFSEGRFSAHGDGAMDAQARIISEYSRITIVRTIAAYVASLGFATISAALIMFAPEHRGVAANIVAGAFLALAVGLAGFTRFMAKAPAIEIQADSMKRG